MEFYAVGRLLGKGAFGKAWTFREGTKFLLRVPIWRCLSSLSDVAKVNVAVHKVTEEHFLFVLDQFRPDNAVAQFRPDVAVAELLAVPSCARGSRVDYVPLSMLMQPRKSFPCGSLPKGPCIQVLRASPCCLSVALGESFALEVAKAQDGVSVFAGSASKMSTDQSWSEESAT